MMSFIFLKRSFFPLIILALCSMPGAAHSQTTGVSAQIAPAQWKNGPSTDPHFFPIAVWLQSSRNAARYKAAGINLYVALADDAAIEPLDELKKNGISLICDQSDFALKNKDHPVIVGWMHGDEPDNAQSIPNVEGYGPPILPQKVIQNYQKLRAADPTRPVLLNLGQGVAWDDYVGRGVRTNHPEDYAEYAKGADIVSFDIYPVTSDESPKVAGKLELVPEGVRRLIEWTHGQKAVWNCIECTHVENPNRKPSPQQVRSEVWMSLIHGSRGLIYFVHEFKPTFKEAGLLADPEMLAAVTAINQQIHALAPVLNSPNIPDRVTVKSSEADAPIALMVKRSKDGLYVFAANMRSKPTRGVVDTGAARVSDAVAAEVLGESRQIPIPTGKFEDEFKPYEVHIYEIKGLR